MADMYQNRAKFVHLIGAGAAGAEHLIGTLKILFRDFFDELVQAPKHVPVQSAGLAFRLLVESYKGDAFYL